MWPKKLKMSWLSSFKAEYSVALSCYSILHLSCELMTNFWFLSIMINYQQWREHIAIFSHKHSQTHTHNIQKQDLQKKITINKRFQWFSQSVFLAVCTHPFQQIRLHFWLYVFTDFKNYVPFWCHCQANTTKWKLSNKTYTVRTTEAQSVMVLII